MGSDRELVGQRVLVTGASGLFGRPLALELAQRNEVFALARFTYPAVRDELESAQIRTISADISTTDAAELPDVDYVVHAAALLPSSGAEADRERTFEVNVFATGRLLRRYQNAKGFLFCSSGSVYAYQGQRPLREEDPYGLHNGIETYSASKIAAEALVSFLSQEQRTPTTIIRIFTLYSPQGGTVTKRVDMVWAGETVPVYPGGPNRHAPLYITDAIDLAQAALAIADVPPLVVNFAGSETAAIQDYCHIAAELAGVVAQFREDPRAYYPIWPDTTRMNSLLGRSRVGVKEGIQMVFEADAARYRSQRIPGTDR